VVVAGGGCLLSCRSTFRTTFYRHHTTKPHKKTGQAIPGSSIKIRERNVVRLTLALMVRGGGAYVVSDDGRNLEVLDGTERHALLFLR
jgi:hypothetical protein